MSVWLDKARCRPDSGHRPFGRTTVRPKFKNFAEDLSCLRAAFGR
jgi:hypothetical protein